MSKNFYFIEAELHTLMLACLKNSLEVASYGIPIESTQGQFEKAPAIYVGWGSMKPHETTTEVGYAFIMPVVISLRQNNPNMLSPICLDVHDALQTLPNTTSKLHLSVWKLQDRQWVGMPEHNMVKAVLQYKAVIYIKV